MLKNQTVQPNGPNENMFIHIYNISKFQKI